jgi:hypothetical protein
MTPNPPSIDWPKITSVGGVRSHMMISTWCYDKYPNLPELDAGKTVTLIDQDGPGLVSCLHISNYYNKQPFDQNPDAAQGLILRVWYDGAPHPAIEMPLMDFLGDIQCQSAYFNNLYFSKVRQSHNFRLPMPFRKHIRITVENTSALNLMGYAEVQWEQIGAIPPECGYLWVDYREGVMHIPQEPVTLWELPGPGSVVAHWLQFEADDPLCPRGEMLCEGNQEIYLDGGAEPALEYLGTEDLYGFSWGFQELQSDFFVAILKREELPGGGARIALLRSRAEDRIRFESSCRLLLTYQHDAARAFNPLVLQAQERGGIFAPYRSCVYYYQG